jgi:hypothetical protein
MRRAGPGKIPELQSVHTPTLGVRSQGIKYGWVAKLSGVEVKND